MVAREGLWEEELWKVLGDVALNAHVGQLTRLTGPTSRFIYTRESTSARLPYVDDA